MLVHELKWEHITFIFFYPEHKIATIWWICEEDSRRNTQRVLPIRGKGNICDWFVDWHFMLYLQYLAISLRKFVQCIYPKMEHVMIHCWNHFSIFKILCTRWKYGFESCLLVDWKILSACPRGWCEEGHSWH